MKEVNGTGCVQTLLAPRDGKIALRPEHIKYLCCPTCKGSFELVSAAREEAPGGHVLSGQLHCKACHTSFPITQGIPRIVPEATNVAADAAANIAANYADDFGFQWNIHFRTQYDSYSGVNVSATQFFEETQWRRKLPGEVILEAGSGAGRFTEHAVSTGAMVVSFDYSNAVEANFRNNGHQANLLIIQASIYDMPFQPETFDKVLCIGVLQHTPDPEKSFESLVKMLQSGGNLVVDAYEKLPGWRHLLDTKYWVRPLTRRIPHRVLYRWCENWVNFLWPLCKFSYQLTGRTTLSRLLLVADYRGVFPLSEEKLKEWSILDTFDMFSRFAHFYWGFENS